MKTELLTKHNVLTDGLKRRYVIGLGEKRFDLESATPEQLVLCVPSDNRFYLNSNPEVEWIEETSWSNLLVKTFKYIQSVFPKTREEILGFKVSWSCGVQFAEKKVITNMVKVEEGLYISINYSASHFMWVISELLEFYGIYSGYFIIHRTPFSEPQEIVNEVITNRKKQFENFLSGEKSLSKEAITKVMKGVDVLNKLLKTLNTSYNDFYMFDSTQSLSNYKSKLLQKIGLETCWTEKQVKTIKKYLDYLTDFYHLLAKEAKKNSDDLILKVNNL